MPNGNTRKVTSNQKKLSARDARRTEASAVSDTSFSEFFKKKTEDITSAVAGSFESNSVLRKKLTNAISTNVNISNIIKKQAAEAFSKFSLSRYPMASKDPTYVTEHNTIEKAVKHVLIETIESVQNSKLEHKIRLNLNDENLSTFGLSRASNGKVTGNINLGKLFDHINSNIGSIISVSSRSTCALTKEAATNEADKLIDNATKPVEKNPENNTNSNVVTNETEIGTKSPNKLVGEKVNLEIATMTSPETQLKYERPWHVNENDISTSVGSFELKGGPIDVTSYHDFFSLNIAFRNVWTEVFSKELPLLGRRLLEEFLALKNFNIPTNEISAISSVEELRELLYRLRTEKERIAANDSSYSSVKTILPELSLSEWSYLDESSKDVLFEIFLAHQGEIARLDEERNKLQVELSYWEARVLAADQEQMDRIKNQIRENSTQVQRENETASEKARTVFSAFKLKPSRLEKLFSDIEQRISERYSFDVFAPNTVNFGLLITYRQEWKPLNFQVGDLVSTIPLAPGETRRYTKKKVVKTHRTQKEIEDSLRVRKTESSQTSRVEAEIVQKASNKTNFHHTAKGSFDAKILDVEATGEITVDSAKESADTKKDFRESVLKAAEEYKQEHRLEISTEAIEEFEETSSGEIKNPNDEIPVTYLFYELQRTYEISEKIHSVRPVILVANDVPGPDEIDEEWLIRYDWILKRVILDDSFIPSLEYLTKGFVGNEIAIEALRNNMEKQLEIVERMSREIEIGTRTFSEFQKALDKSVESYARAVEAGDNGGGIWGFLTDIFMPGDIVTSAVKAGVDALTEEVSKNPEAARIRLQGATDALMRAERHLKELRTQMEVESTALQVAIDKYTQAVKDHFNWKTNIGRLRIHIKENILYYMQAIWNHEPPDQRFFRLYKIKVPIEDLKPTSRPVVINSTFGPGGPIINVNSVSRDWASFGFDDKTELNEIADLDKLLGYKGNYMIFPLKEMNYLVNYMLQDFIDVHIDNVYLKDPDEFGEYTLEQIKEYMLCLYKENPTSFNKLYRDKFRKILIDRMLSGRKEKEMIIVPTDSLYIEALPGKHPLLEDFKLLHRALDVKKVQAEVRHAELENIRLAARALKGKYEDPDIEKKIIIEGDSKGIVVPSDTS